MDLSATGAGERLGEVLPIRGRVRSITQVRVRSPNSAHLQTGDFQWSVPNEQIFNLATDEVRRASVHLLGRRLYESMLFWENHADDDALGFSTHEFARLWRGLPKLVFSHSLTSVEGNARLATGTLAQEIERLRSEPGAGDIAIGGATLAAQAVELGLIDEYRLRIYPVLVGGGVPYFPHGGNRADLELLEVRALEMGVVYVRYGRVN